MVESPQMQGGGFEIFRRLQTPHPLHRLDKSYTSYFPADFFMHQIDG